MSAGASTESAPATPPPSAGHAPSELPALPTDSAFEGPSPAPLALAGPVVLSSGLLSIAIIIAGLYFGRAILMPLALAVLIGFVLAPLVSWLKRRGLPRLLAVSLVMAAALGLVAATGLFVVGQMREIANDLPQYQTTITKKLRDLTRSVRGPGVLDQASRVVNKVEQELEAATRAAQARLPKAEAPMRVEVVGQSVSPLQRLVRWVERFAEPVATAGIVLIFVALILLDKSDLRDRVLRLLGSNLHRTTDALSEAAQRVSKYLAMQLVVNATYGIPLAAGLWFIGVPGALVWGLLGAVLRFVPYVGPMIAAIFPVTLAFAVDPGWNMVLWTAGLIIALEVISNNVIEPWLYGTSTGLATMSLIVAAMFWTALWGPMGLLLSTPMTVVLLVLGRYIPQLQFLEVLLGSESALDAPTRMHQRLLAGDVEDAIELAESLALEASPEAFYAGVGLGVLRLASRTHETATAEHRHRVVSGMGRVIEELREQHPPESGLPVRVACLGGRWAVDALAADMAAHVLALKGIGSRSAQVSLQGSDQLALPDLDGVELICLCSFSPDPLAYARLLVRRVRRRWPSAQIIVAAFDHPQAAAQDAARRVGADVVVRSLDELLAQIEARLSRATGDPADQGDDAERVEALRASGLLDASARGRLDAAAQHVADVFDCAVATVTLIDADAEWTHGDSRLVGRPETGAPVRTAGRDQSLGALVIASGETLVVPDLQRDPRTADHPLVTQYAMRFYAGAPLRARKGQIIGSLNVLDTAPRDMDARDTGLLEKLAAEVVAGLAHDQRQAQLARSPSG